MELCQMYLALACISERQMRESIILVLLRIRSGKRKEIHGLNGGKA